MLAKILGHADLSLLMRYVHPSQADMDRGMEWYSSMQTPGTELEEMLLDYEDGKNESESWPGPTLGPSTSPKPAQSGPTRPNSRNLKVS